MPERQYVSTAEVARALGVGVSTVKRWVDDGILPAHKTAGGHRKLLLADVMRLVHERSLPQANLGLLTAAGRGDGLPDPDGLSRNLFAALRGGDEDAVRNVVARAFDGGVSVETLADGVVAPAMHRIGADWEAGRIDVLHEHRASQLCTAALYELRPRLEAHAERRRPRALGGAPEDNHHALASLLAEFVLLAAGWEAVNLGPNTPVASFRKALAELQPRLLWLSVGHLPDAAAFLAGYQELYQDAQKAGVAVAVGGRALTADVRALMPYTTFGDGMTHLAAFARSLHPRPRPRKRGRPRRAAQRTAPDDTIR